MDSAGRFQEGSLSPQNEPYASDAESQARDNGQSKVEASKQALQFTAEDLKDCDWNELQEKYSKAMEAHGQLEDNLRDQTAKLIELFTSWSQTTVDRDENRALKRFKTQMQHVQNSEGQLENKRKHYDDVVRAFQSAMALLNNRMKI